MEKLLAVSNTFSLSGHYVLIVLAILSCLLGISGAVNLFRSRPVFERSACFILVTINVIFVVGFLLICWFHYQINCHLVLELPPDLAAWLNKQIQAMNRNAAYALPLYESAAPPRYAIPVWIENEKYYFWFMSYSVMALIAHLRLHHNKFRSVLHIFLAVQVMVLVLYTDPFVKPLPRFFAEVSPWFELEFSAMKQVGFFMRLYPRMVFYYNAHYMWFHPPLLFLAYACITLTFITSIFMLFRRDLAMETMGYSFAKFGYFMLTLGMLLGYPWALQAWGPNWWWDPKICSSIMMWVIFSTYLHARLYANKPSMWYFSSILGILCFLAMIFTFITSFYFPGEHTLQ